MRRSDASTLRSAAAAEKNRHAKSAQAHRLLRMGCLAQAKPHEPLMAEVLAASVDAAGWRDFAIKTRDLPRAAVRRTLLKHFLNESLILSLSVKKQSDISFFFKL